MSVRPLLLSLFVLSISSLAFAQNEQASQNQQAGQEQKTQEKARPTPTPPTVTGVSTYAKEKLCSPKCEAGIGNKIVVQITNMDTAKYPPKDLVLFLDGQPIKGKENAGVPVKGGELIPVPSPDLYLVEFQLNRTEDSRAAWTALLGSPSLTKSHRPVTVSVGPADAQPFAYTDPNNKPQIELRSYYRGWLIGMSLFVIAAVLVFLYLARTTNIIRDSNPPQPPEGARKPYSLALAQAAFWFFLVFGSFLFIALVTGDYNSTITQQALVLMGIGTGTALGAAMIDSTKRSSANATISTQEPKRAELEEEAKQLQAKVDSLKGAATAEEKKALDDASVQLKATEAKLQDTTAQMEDAKSGLSKPVSDGFPRDLLTDADGVNFHRFQMVIWTIVLGSLFVYGVYQELAMPEFSATLLALMGISAGTYLGFKIPEKQS
ncbi:MAG TPA: hypothetical protein VEM96_01360 [Pyrinomonadaceae bacterium]|nr:hypothetical protein [Pyrinomonadaceae bacterium]